MMTGSADVLMALLCFVGYNTGMTWQAGQYIPTQRSAGGAALGGMLASVFAASQKPTVEAALAQVHSLLEQVPGDIDWTAFAAGVQRYAAAGERVPRSVYKELMRVGRVTLLDAGGTGDKGHIVVVPSMVNRGYVLDLWPGHSLVEYLREAGWHVLLVDWGVPEDEVAAKGDAPLSFETVIVERLLPLLLKAREVAGAPVSVFGYCMGGLLALGGAVLAGKEVVGKLAVAAMPWDFSVTPSSGHMVAARPVIEPFLSGQQVVSAAAMQQYFWLLDPWSPVRRLMAYGRETDLARLAYLTALEDWLADGLGLDGPIAAEMLLGWYADNRTMKGTWTVGGKTITPAALEVPLWVGITQKDVLVPTACALPLVGQSKGAVVHMADTGHVGLVCGRKARTQFYEPLEVWMSGKPA